ncbi:MAG: hypothetical protein EBY22_10585 [Gammaproteobacteria bacterium]|nr:hypothetical protein [Gammaproteobacteria bacterium]
MKIFILVLLFVLLVAFGPLATIWSLNTLFPALAIPYDIWTWLAVIWLGAIVGAKRKVDK